MSATTRDVLVFVVVAAALTTACGRAGGPGGATASATNGSASGAAAAAGSASGSAGALSALREEDRVYAGGIAPPAGALASRDSNEGNNAKDGAQLFSAMNCDGCHGGGGSGWVGPNLADGRFRYGGRDEEIFSSIFYGRPKGMPAYGGVVGRDGALLLVGYIKSLPRPDVVPTQSWITPEATKPAPERGGTSADHP